MSRRALRGTVLPVLLLTAWEITSHSGAIDPRILPPLELVAHTAWVQVTQQGLVRISPPVCCATWPALPLAHSSVRASVSFSDCPALRIDCSHRVSTGCGRSANLAWIPLVSIWFGVGEAAKVVFIMAAAFVPMVLNTCEGIRGASVQLIEVAHALTFSKWQLLTRLYLPSALPSIATGLHLALIYAWVASVGAEYFMTIGPGIGGLSSPAASDFRWIW